MNKSPLNIVVVDYNGGNLASAERVTLYAAQQMNRSVNVTISNQPDTILNADRIILPGQGAFADCMNGLLHTPHLLESLEQSINKGTPFLGICVGMQLMAERGLEHNTTKGLGWVNGEIAPMTPANLPLPQMGWNELLFNHKLGHPILEGIDPGNHAYFVHSFALTKADPKDIIATTDYGGSVPAIIAKGNKIGTQFHVEKSQEVGLRILANFLNWNMETYLLNHQH